MEVQKNHKSNMDMLRTISTFMIVLLHVSAGYWESAELNSSTFGVMTFYNGICRSAVPLFLMISGMFMIPKDIEGKYLPKKILKLLGCFFLWSFFYAAQGLAIKFLLGRTITAEDFHVCIREFLFGHYHQWFLLMLAGIYLILPFVRKICLDKKTMQYFILLWLISNIIIPLISVDSFTALFQLHFTIGFVGYFVIGYYISECNIEKKYRICLYISGIAATIYTVAATIFDCRSSETYIQAHNGSFTWNVFLMAVSMFVFFRYKPEKERKIFSKLAGTSLIVYMLHPFFIEKIGLLKYNPCWTVPVISVLVYCACVIAALIFYSAITFLKNHSHASKNKVPL